MTPATSRTRGAWTGLATGLVAGLALVLSVALGWIGRGGDGAQVATPVLVVDPNTAPPGVLEALPRLGPVLVGRIVEAREHEPFHSVEDLDARVKGIGPVTIEGLRPHLRIAPVE